MKGVKLSETAGGHSALACTISTCRCSCDSARRPISQRPAYLFGGPSFDQVGQQRDARDARSNIRRQYRFGAEDARPRFPPSAAARARDYLIEGRFTAGVTDIGQPAFPHANRLAQSGLFRAGRPQAPLSKAGAFRLARSSADRRSLWRRRLTCMGQIDVAGRGHHATQAGGSCRIWLEKRAASLARQLRRSALQPREGL